MDRRVEPVSNRRSRLMGVAAAWLVVASLFSTIAAEAKDGDVVQVEGQILDEQGTPVSGVSVMLEATRTSFSWLKRKTESEPPLQQLEAQLALALKLPLRHHGQ